MGEMMDNVKHPNHYTYCGIECIAAIEAVCSSLIGFEGYCAGNIIKYIWRHKFKNGIEDLKKAREYIDFLIEYEEEQDAKH